jgi:predicted Zn-dependent protease with MMP-like domain
MDFEQQVHRAIASLPAELRAALENVAVTVEEAYPQDPDLYGLYEGTPLIEPADWAGQMPARIRIFRRPLSQDFPDEDDLVEEIRVTVLHELAHHFGLDEERLDELGYG